MDILICGDNQKARELKEYLEYFGCDIKLFIGTILKDYDFDELVNRYEVFDDHIKPDPFDLVIDKTDNPLSHSVISYICMKFKIPVL